MRQSVAGREYAEITALLHPNNGVFQSAIAIQNIEANPGDRGSPQQRGKSVGRRRSASISKTLLSALRARVRATLKAVVVFPSPGPGLEISTRRTFSLS